MPPVGVINASAANAASTALMRSWSPGLHGGITTRTRTTSQSNVSPVPILPSPLPQSPLLTISPRPNPMCPCLPSALASTSSLPVILLRLVPLPGKKSPELPKPKLRRTQRLTRRSERGPGGSQPRRRRRRPSECRSLKRRLRLHAHGKSTVRPAVFPARSFSVLVLAPVLEPIKILTCLSCSQQPSVRHR
jgi:hypothetical protein